MSALGRVSTVDALVAELRARLLDGDFSPGDKLKEVELAQRYGVGRYSLRGAMRVLTDEGLLRHEQHRGVFVPELTRQDVTDLFVLRRAVEVEAVRRVVQTRTTLAAAEKAVQRLEQLTGDEPWHEVTEADLAFHTALVSGAGSNRLERAFSPLAAELRLCMARTQTEYADDPARAGREHREILTALQTGRPATAERAIRKHLEDGAQALLSHFP